MSANFCAHFLPIIFNKSYAMCRDHNLWPTSASLYYSWFLFWPKDPTFYTE